MRQIIHYYFVGFISDKMIERNG